MARREPKPTQERLGPLGARKPVAKGLAVGQSRSMMRSITKGLDHDESRFRALVWCKACCGPPRAKASAGEVGATQAAQAYVARG